MRLCLALNFPPASFAGRVSFPPARRESFQPAVRVSFPTLQPSSAGGLSARRQGELSARPGSGPPPPGSPLPSGGWSGRARGPRPGQRRFILSARALSPAFEPCSSESWTGWRQFIFSPALLPCSGRRGRRRPEHKRRRRSYLSHWAALRNFGHEKQEQAKGFMGRIKFSANSRKSIYSCSNVTVDLAEPEIGSHLVNETDLRLWREPEWPSEPRIPTLPYTGLPWIQIWLLLLRIGPGRPARLVEIRGHASSGSAPPVSKWHWSVRAARF